jgi:hypothetical protein
MTIARLLTHKKTRPLRQSLKRPVVFALFQTETPLPMAESSGLDPAATLLPIVPTFDGRCSNCGTPIQGKFCVECGQKTPVRRINFREGWNDFWSRVYGFDGMFPRTLRDLTIRPGHAARAYLDGVRVKYYGPVGYFFLMITIYLLVTDWLDISPKELVEAMGANTAKPGSGQEQFNLQNMSWINDNQRLVSFLMIPIYVLGAKLFFKKEKLNYLEHSVLVFYTQGHLQWLSIIFLFTLAGFGFFPNFFLFMLLQVTFYSFACTQLYKSYKPWVAFFRGVFVNLFFWVSFIIVIVIVMIVALAMDSALLEQVRPSNN